MGKLPDNYKEGLESELAGLEARIGALGPDGDPAVLGNLERRVGEVCKQLSRRPPAKQKRPGGSGAEKRPG